MIKKKKRLWIYSALCELWWISFMILYRHFQNDFVFLATNLGILVLLLLWSHFKIVPTGRRSLSGKEKVFSVISTLILLISLRRFGTKPTSSMFYFLIVYGALLFAFDVRWDFRYLKRLENKENER